MSELKDMKEGLRSARKPDITHVRTSFKVYVARNCEYGGDKYERANYLRPVDGTRAAFERYRSYLRAVDSHLSQTLDAMERHQALDPKLEDVEGMKRAAYAVDTDETPGSEVGASFLPHIGGACASLNMAIEQAVTSGLLPADPGQPWAEDRPWKGSVEIDNGRMMAIEHMRPLTWPDWPEQEDVREEIPTAGVHGFPYRGAVVIEHPPEIDLESISPGMAVGRETETRHHERVFIDGDSADDWGSRAHDPQPIRAKQDQTPCDYCGCVRNIHLQSCAGVK